MTVNQQYLNNYFLNVWSKEHNPSLADTKSGIQLIKKIKPNETVIDIGCGTNPFKKLIPNLTGIDPTFPQADIKSTIEEFNTTEKYDVAFCLGSINFGNVDHIETQITKIATLVNDTGRIYWRCNPGRRDHNNTECNEIEFYPWTISEHIRLSDKFGFRLQECCWENNGRRIYAEWKRR